MSAARRPDVDTRARAIAAVFAVEGTLSGLETHEGGHINESWVARFANARGATRFLLQHINRFVFREPARLMENMVRVTRHVAAHLERDAAPDPRRRVLALVPTRTGSTHHTEPDGEVWRLMPFIEGTRSREVAGTAGEAEAAARAFGHFLCQLADLAEPPLHETIPRFHDTPWRFTALEEAVALARGRIAAAGIRVEIDPDLPTVRADRLRLLELVQNLVDNAVRFMGETEEPRIHIGWRRTDAAPVVFVQDNGMGMDPAHHETVFGLFDKLDPCTEGSGVGLALARRIVEVHGGRIWIESEGKDRGTAVCFTLTGGPPSTPGNRG